MSILQKPKYQFGIFLFIFLIINLLQSYNTALFEDEAYYWVWSKDLAFGYFDHPPLVALWIKISSFFFDGELGVRFFSTISFTLMLIFIWLLIDIKEKWNYVWLFFLLIVSVVFLNVYGFITTPDTPLLLFVAVFLYFYKQFLKNDNWTNTLLLGFSMAALLYSKYHGVLIILFTLLSNIHLLKNKKFWVAGFFGALLFIPHLYWQYANDFPSFRYHLIERGAKKYKIGHTLIHFVNQIAIVGITFPVIYLAFFKQRINSKFERALKFITIGFIIFFFFSTFKSNPQAQWTAAILIPLIVLSFPYFIHHQKARKWLIILGTIQFGILLIIRVFLANSSISPIVLEPHIAESWVSKLKKNTNNKPIVFLNSYRNASMYSFYTGIETHSYSLLRGRKSQYDLGNFEDKIQHKDIFVVSKFFKNHIFFAKKLKDSLKGYPIQNYTTFQKVKCIIEEESLLMKEGEKFIFTFKFTNTYDKNINFDHAKFIGVFQGYKNIILAQVPIEISKLEPLEANEKKEFKATITVPQIVYNDDITFRVAIDFYDMQVGFQGNKVQTVISKKSSSQ